MIAFLGIFYYSTISSVPFHPDEATFIYMSHDFHKLITDPASMIYLPEKQSSIEQHYRLIDPPLTRYLIGAGLSLSDMQSISTDWDWELSWNENLEAGALPDTRLLTLSRLSVSCFFLVALYAIFRTGKNLHNAVTGLISMLLVGTSALILLHTRRAMEESLLLLGVCLSLWSLFSINKRPWLSGLALVLAVNAKLSAFPLVLMAIAAIFLMDTTQTINWFKRLVNVLIVSSILIIGTYLLNPIAWNQPISVLQLSLHERNTLVSEQLTSIQLVDPTHALTNPNTRIAGIITHLFISQPAALDIGNYLKELKPSIDAYRDIPFSSFMRGYFGGVGVFFLFLFGFVLMLSKLILNRKNINKSWIVFVSGFLIFLTAMVSTVSLPFQRYVLPLLPFIYLYISFGISQVLFPSKKAPH